MTRKIVPIWVLALFLIVPTISGKESSPIIPVRDDAFQRVIVQPSSAVIYETFAMDVFPSAKPQVSLRPAKPRVIAKATPKPTAKPIIARKTSHSIRGKASWYCNYDDSSYVRSVCHYKYPDDGGADLYAAACYKLRVAMGPNWRGKYVTVSGNGNTVRVRLIDYCASKDKTIDLYRDSMDRLGPSSGGYGVTVRW